MKFNRYFIKKNRYLKTVIFSLGFLFFWIYLIVKWVDFVYSEKIVTNILRNIAFEVILNPAFYLIVIAILYLELIIPAKRDQKIFSVGMIQDIVWFIFDIILTIALLSPYVALLQSISENYLEFLNIKIFNNLPSEVIFLISILVSDFLLWFSHFIRHKIPILWCFHAVHHSQKELNLFSDLRFHFVDYLFTYTVVVIPMSVFKIPLPTVAIYLITLKWYLRFCHANLKINFGWLRYILVTPQSHRIHHSIETKHYDKNFASLFSIWDYLFNTQYKNHREYPDTGLSDRNFPLEKSINAQNLLKTYFLQLIYPFRLLLRIFVN